jgi:hypothetical protein
VSSSTILCGTTRGSIYYKTANTGNYDVAENYSTLDQGLTPGTIATLDLNNPGSITTAGIGSTPLGIISTDPGLLLGGADGSAASTQAALALSGRVPLRVALDNGPISVGDHLVLSTTTPGVAVKAVHSGMTIGIALENFVASSTNDVISVFVSQQQWFAPNDLSVDSSTGNISVGGAATSSAAFAVHGDVAAASFIVSGVAPAFIDQFAGFTIGTTTASSTLSDDGTGVNLYRLATYTLSSVQILAEQTATLASTTAALGTQVNDLAARVTALEAGATAGLANATSTGSTSLLSATTTQLASALESVGVLLQNGIAQFNTLVVRDLVFSKDTGGASAAGSGTVLAGNTVVEVDNSHMLATSQVSITPTSPVNGDWYVSQKADGSFRITLSAAQPADFTFDYLIVQTQGQIATTTPTGYAGSPFSWISSLFGNSTTTPPPAPGTSGNSNPGGSGTAAGATSSSTPSSGGTASSTPSGTASSTPSASAPTVTLNGGAAISLTQGDIFTDPGATAKDASGADISNSITESGSVDTNTPGIYTLTYTATDGAGNTGTASRVVTVSAAPVVTPPSTPPAPPASPPAAGDSSGSSSSNTSGSGSATPSASTP